MNLATTPDFIHADGTRYQLMRRAIINSDGLPAFSQLEKDEIIPPLSNYIYRRLPDDKHD